MVWSRRSSSGEIDCLKLNNEGVVPSHEIKLIIWFLFLVFDSIFLLFELSFVLFKLAL